MPPSSSSQDPLPAYASSPPLPLQSEPLPTPPPSPGILLPRAIILITSTFTLAACWNGRQFPAVDFRTSASSSEERYAIPSAIKSEWADKRVRGKGKLGAVMGTGATLAQEMAPLDHPPCRSIGFNIFSIKIPVWSFAIYISAHFLPFQKFSSIFFHCRPVPDCDCISRRSNCLHDYTRTYQFESLLVNVFFEAILCAGRIIKLLIFSLKFGNFMIEYFCLQ